jgi:ketosteroid isomerase-like protein
MSEQDNAQKIEAVYAAFGRGDLPFILNVMAEDVNWVHPRPADIPWGGTRRGREGVTQFFAAIAGNVDFEDFGVDRLVSRGGEVIVFGHEQVRTKSSGQRYRVDWVHSWTFRAGAVVEFREYTDTATIVEALNSR